MEESVVSYPTLLQHVHFMPLRESNSKKVSLDII